MIGIDTAHPGSERVFAVYDDGRPPRDITHLVPAHRAMIEDQEARRIYHTTRRAGLTMANASAVAAFVAALDACRESGERVVQALERMGVDIAAAMDAEPPTRVPRTLARGHEVNPYAAGRKRPRGERRTGAPPAPPAVKPGKALARPRKT